MDEKEEPLPSAPEEKKKNKIHPSSTLPSIYFSPEAPIQVLKKKEMGLAFVMLMISLVKDHYCCC